MRVRWSLRQVKSQKIAWFRLLQAPADQMGRVLTTAKRPTLRKSKRSLSPNLWKHLSNTLTARRDTHFHLLTRCGAHGREKLVVGLPQPRGRGAPRSPTSPARSECPSLAPSSPHLDSRLMAVAASRPSQVLRRDGCAGGQVQVRDRGKKWYDAKIIRCGAPAPPRCSAWFISRAS